MLLMLHIVHAAHAAHAAASGGGNGGDGNGDGDGGGGAGAGAGGGGGCCCCCCCCSCGCCRSSAFSSSFCRSRLYIVSTTVETFRCVHRCTFQLFIPVVSMFGRLCHLFVHALSRLQVANAQ